MGLVFFLLQYLHFDLLCLSIPLIPRPFSNDDGDDGKFQQTGVVFSGGGGHDSFTHMSISSSGAAGSIALDCSDEEAPVLGAGLVGRAVCKEFDFGGTLTGTVSYAHRPDGEVLVYRVVSAMLFRY